jgi:hypothetical protein
MVSKCHWVRARLLDDEFSGDDVSQQDMERVLRAWEG